MYQAVANDGVLIPPRIVDQVVDPDGTVHDQPPAEARRVVGSDTAADLRYMLESVTNEGGTAPLARIDGYRVAGKTGTAQRVGPEGGYDGTFTVSFAGFAPADDPRFTIYVVVQNPRNGGGGGSVGGPAFSKMMGYTLRRYGVPPTGTQPSRLPVEW